MANVNINALATGQAIGWSGGLQITEQSIASGEISAESNATATTIALSSADFTNKVQVEIFDTNGASEGITPDNTENHILIPTNYGGLYLIVVSMCFSGTGNNTISFACFKNNGATQITTRATRKLGTGGDTGAAGCFGLAALSDADTVELWVQNETGGNNITVEDVSLSIARVGT